jgi:hypothetical protein
VGFTWVLLGVIGLAGMGTAAEACTVGVRVHNTFAVPPGALFLAKSMAGEMFARIGVQVQWQGGAVRESERGCWRPIEIYLEAGRRERPPGLDGLYDALPGRRRPHTRLRGPGCSHGTS